MTDELPDDDIPEGTDEDIKPESVEESVRTIFDGLDEAQADGPLQGREGADEADDESVAQQSSGRARDARGRFAPAEGAQADGEGDPGQGEAPPGTEQRQAARLDAPARWAVPEKEAFNRLPDVAKHQVLDFWSHMDKKFTNGSQELARHRQRYGQIEDVVNHYLPQWGLKGMTDVQAISELCAAQDFLVRSPLEAMALLCDRTGVTPEQLYQYRQSGGQGQQAAPRQADPQISQLTDRVNAVYDWVQRGQESAADQQVQAGVAEVNAVRNSQSNGRYLYPELWDDAYLVERVQPLVGSMRKTQPGLPIGESVRRAVHTLRILDGNVGGHSPYGSGLSREEIANVKRASVSVRGRGNGAYPNAAKAGDGEKLTDSLEAVWEQLSSR